MTSTSRTTSPTYLNRLRDLEPGRRRLLAVVVAVLAVVALSIPIGLSVLGMGGIPTPSSGGAVGSRPMGDTASSSDGAPAAPGYDKGSAAAGETAQSGVEAPGAPAARDAKTTTDGSPGAAQVSVVGRRIARSAWLGVKVTDLIATSAKARLVATAAGGTVVSENVVTANDPTGGAYRGGAGPAEDKAVPPVGVDEARLVLSVPSDKLDGVVNELSKIGTVSYRSSQSQDLTETYVDTSARIQPAKDGIARIRALLLKATSLDQVVALEAEVSRRQADLDSLQQRLAQLEQLTSMSEVTLALWTDSASPVEPEDESSGFLANLKDAWNALLTSLTVILTGFAVLLPWLVLAGLVAWLVHRARRRRPASAPAGGV